MRYKHISLRKVYSPVKLPWLARLYRFAYDHTSLSRPTILYGHKTPWRLITQLLFKRGHKNITGQFCYGTGKNTRLCHFRVHNTQFHAIYFNRFQPVYEPEVCALLDLFITDQTCFYDIGAN